MSYKIEKGIPMPSSRETSLTATLRVMDVGDSFVYDGKINTIVSIVSRLKATEKKVYQIRKCEGGFRVWRVA